MNDLQVGKVIRAVRRRFALRQADVAERARVSQQLISLIERGRLDEVSLPRLRRVAAALEIQIDMSARWRGSAADRLLDTAHSTIVDRILAVLGGRGWMPVVEWSFNHFGERGSVDIVAWQPQRRALVIIEVKSELIDAQSALAQVNRYTRIATELLPRERGWVVDCVGALLVLPARSSTRDAVAARHAMFGVAFPARTREVLRWLQEPVGSLRGLWFLRITSQAGRTVRRAGGSASARAVPTVLTSHTGKAGLPRSRAARDRPSH